MIYQIHQRDAVLKGKEEQARESAKKMYTHGDDVNYIAEIVGFTVETVKKWLGL